MFVLDLVGCFAIDRGVVSEVECVLDSPMFCCPFLLVASGVDAEHLSDCFVCAFDLPVSLLMESGGEDEFDVENVMKSFPEC